MKSFPLIPELEGPIITATEAGGERGLLNCEIPQAELQQCVYPGHKAPLWAKAFLLFGGLHEHFWELTETGSTRQTSPVETPACLGKGTVPAADWRLIQNYHGFFHPNSLVRATENFVESTETCFWNRRILQVNVSTVPLCFASLGTPNFWPESSPSKTMGSPQCHVLLQVSPYFWTHSERLCPPAELSSCSQLLPPASDLLKATWEIPHLVRDFLKQTVYIRLILPVDLKKNLLPD